MNLSFARVVSATFEGGSAGFEGERSSAKGRTEWIGDVTQRSGGRNCRSPSTEFCCEIVRQAAKKKLRT